MLFGFSRKANPKWVPRFGNGVMGRSATKFMTFSARSVVECLGPTYLYLGLASFGHCACLMETLPVHRSWCMYQHPSYPT